MATFHKKPLDSFQRTGTSLSAEMPVPLGPRKRGQSAARAGWPAAQVHPATANNNPIILACMKIVPPASLKVGSNRRQTYQNILSDRPSGGIVVCLNHP